MFNLLVDVAGAPQGSKIVSEYDQGIPQSQTADQPIAPRGRATPNHKTTGRLTKQSNQLSFPHQDDCKTRITYSKTYNNYRLPQWE